MKIQILGTGCPKCEKLYAHCQEAAGGLGVSCDISKVQDINEIVAMGVMMTPGLVIDGEVKSQGKLLSVDEIKALIG